MDDETKVLYAENPRAIEDSVLPAKIIKLTADVQRKEKIETHEKFRTAQNKNQKSTPFNDAREGTVQSFGKYAVFRATNK